MVHSNFWDPIEYWGAESNILHDALGDSWLKGSMQISNVGTLNELKITFVAFKDCFHSI